MKFIFIETRFPTCMKWLVNTYFALDMTTYLFLLCAGHGDYNDEGSHDQIFVPQETTRRKQESKCANVLHFAIVLQGRLWRAGASCKIQQSSFGSAPTHE